MRLTLDALSTLREEEIPRRIAFVSDQIFEPRWYTRAFRALWSPNFAAACVVAGAILVHAFHGTAPDRAAGSMPKSPQPSNTAVTKAVAAEEQRHAQQVDAVISQFAERQDEMYVRTAGFVHRKPSHR